MEAQAPDNKQLVAAQAQRMREYFVCSPVSSHLRSMKMLQEMKKAQVALR